MATVVLFGGGGFLGRRLVDRLSAESVTVRIAVRHPEPARIALRSLGFDRVTVVYADVRDQGSVAAAIAGADAGACCCDTTHDPAPVEVAAEGARVVGWAGGSWPLRSFRLSYH